MEWVWSSPYHGSYVNKHFLLGSNYNAGESFRNGNGFSPSDIPNTNNMFGQSNFNHYNINGIDNLLMAAQSVVKQEVESESERVHFPQTQMCTWENQQNENNCGLISDEFKGNTTTNEVAKEDTNSNDMHVVKDQFSIKRKINNIYNYKAKPEFQAEDIIIKQENVSEIHADSDTHIILDKINVQQRVSNIQNYLVKLENFDTEEIVVNQNNSNQNGDKTEYNQIVCKKEYSKSKEKQNLNKNYLKSEKSKLLLDKSEKPMINAIKDAISILANSKTVIKNTDKHNWNCTLCIEKFFKKGELKQHMLTHSESDVFICSVCQYKTSRKNRLEVHMRSHTGERPFKCTECDFTFTQGSNLKFHILRYHTRELTCSDCKMIFKGKMKLDWHKKVVHSADKRYACNVCDYRTDDSSALKCHLVTHSGIKKYICPDCSKGFRDNYGLKIHMLIHSGGKMLNCPECKYLTLDQSNLERHMSKVHSIQNSDISIIAEGKNVCEDCGYSCKSKVLFDKHKQIHVLNGKLLKCPKCAYKCGKYSTMREHSLAHKDKVLRCKECNFRFINKMCYDAHMITHNNVNIFL